MKRIRRIPHLRLARHLSYGKVSLPAARALSATPGSRRQGRLFAMWLLRR